MNGRRAVAPLALIAAAALGQAAPATAAPLKVVRASADATVRADHPRATDGRSELLRVAAHPATRTYLRFPLTGLEGRLVQRATLWVRVDAAHPWRGLAAAATDGRAWSERRLTWRSRPAARPPVGTATRAPGAWRAIDVTSLVRANGRLDLVLTATRGTGAVLASREAGRADAPRLRLRTVRDVQPAFPVRTALYDTQRPAGRYHPSRGRYDGDNALV
ncbi:MAG TPA: DNRLRE domain-containing protein, partial [Solirubrobacteraceae bacterium]